MKHSVLIVSEQAAFARELVQRWQTERAVPAFTLLSGQAWKGSGPAADLIIVGGSGIVDSRLDLVLAGFETKGVHSICVHHDRERCEQLRHTYTRCAPVHEAGEWMAITITLATEMLRRADILQRLRRVESALHAQQRQAALGRYMLDMRHNFNNALTSVLGNAELLMLDSAMLPRELREQVDTIHNMALRLHEMMQRFSSLEAEMNVAEGEAVAPQLHSQAQVAGS